MKTFWIDRGKNPLRKRPKAPRSMERELLTNGPPELAEAVREADELEMAALEQELFKQRKRIADAERALLTKETKKAREEARIGRNKVEAALERLEELKSSGSGSGLGRIYPGSYCPVVVMENGERVIRPMRYRCRLPGWTEVVERKYPGTYNARRDKLEESWGKVFGYNHGVVLATAFYEHVDREGKDTILEFKPQASEGLIAACLWTHTVDADGGDLLSFALVTDDPPPEVAAAGHDRCIIPLKPENVNAWLQPDPKNLAALYAILDDRERPYYEHREAA
ncbi:SOS response-associated peptidase family protein [Lysobacter sp. M2-1]|uniref:SOS response-associated peptidase family protein n=1 Tax=Lysobacter sp. M2-1 TaxID=2916839 RepID=UPI0031F30AB8